MSISFSQALDEVKNGKKIQRTGWNGKGMYVRLVDPYCDKVFKIKNDNTDDGTPLPWLGMKTADNQFVPWLASQADLLLNDWQIVGETP